MITFEPQQYPIGLAWIDVSTGEFFSKYSDSESLRDDITRIGPPRGRAP